MPHTLPLKNSTVRSTYIRGEINAGHIIIHEWVKLIKKKLVKTIFEYQLRLKSLKVNKSLREPFSCNLDLVYYLWKEKIVTCVGLVNRDSIGSWSHQRKNSGAEAQRGFTQQDFLKRIQTANLFVSVFTNKMSMAFFILIC